MLIRACGYDLINACGKARLHQISVQMIGAVRSLGDLHGSVTSPPDSFSAYGSGLFDRPEMRRPVGDNPERVRSEAASAKLGGVCPIPDSGSKTSRMRPKRGGNRQANAALRRRKLRDQSRATRAMQIGGTENRLLNAVAKLAGCRYPAA